LIGLHKNQVPSVRFRIGRCWLIIIRLNKDLLIAKYIDLFSFFYENLSVENYEMNFTGAEFFLYLVDEEEDEAAIKNKFVCTTLENNLKQ
jgi:hypothetical protein